MPGWVHAPSCTCVDCDQHRSVAASCDNGTSVRPLSEQRAFMAAAGLPIVGEDTADDGATAYLEAS